MIDATDFSQEIASALKSIDRLLLSPSADDHKALAAEFGRVASLATQGQSLAILNYHTMARK